MKNMKKLSVVFLPAVVGLACAVCLAVRCFLPFNVLPKLSIPNTVLLSLVALLAQHYIKRDGGKVNLLLVFLFAGLSFGLLPALCGFTPFVSAWKPALVGAVTYTLTAFLFEEMTGWLSTGSNTAVAPAVSALGLYLASQCFAGMLL